MSDGSTVVFNYAKEKSNVPSDILEQIDLIENSQFKFEPPIQSNKTLKRPMSSKTFLPVKTKNFRMAE